MHRGAVVLTSLALLLAPACSDEPFDEFGQVVSYGDSALPGDGALPGDPDSGPGICSAVCPPAQGDTICLKGHVFEAMSLITRGADHATVLTKSDKIQVRVYDPVSYVSNPLTSPMSIVDVDDNGCFIVEKLNTPNSGAFAMVVEDAEIQSSNLVAPTATLVIPNPGQNAEEIELYSITSTMASDMDLSLKGALIIFFRNSTTGKGEPGVTPTIDDAPPPWDEEVRFFSDAPVSPPYFVQGASETTSSGLIAIPAALVKNYSGTKNGCAIGSHLAGTSPSIITIKVLAVTGC